MEDSKDIKLTEVPEGTILSNTLKLISNADGHIRQIGVDLLKEYITTFLSEQIQTINNYIGNLQSLSTSEKANVIGAINEVNNSISTTNLSVQQNTENINLLKMDLPEFDIGDTGNVTCLENGNTEVTVSFNRTFTNIPRVAVTSNYSGYMRGIAVTNITKIGCKILFANTTGSSIVNNASWIAIGLK